MSTKRTLSLILSVLVLTQLSKWLCLRQLTLICSNRPFFVSFSVPQ
jgi:hypothetical protein